MSLNPQLNRTKACKNILQLTMRTPFPLELSRNTWQPLHDNDGMRRSQHGAQLKDLEYFIIMIIVLNLWQYIQSRINGTSEEEDSEGRFYKVNRIQPKLS